MALSVSAFPRFGLPAVALYFLLTVPAAAQFRNFSGDGLPNDRGMFGSPVRGEIVAEGGVDFTTMQVHLLDNNGRSYVSDVSATGSFQLPNIAPGTYEMQLMGRTGNVIQSEFVTLPNPMLRVKLRDFERRERPVSGTISITRLEHKVPGKAQKEFKNAARAVDKGEAAQAIEHLQKAIEIDPDYMEAHNNLGVRYMLKGDFQTAMTHFDRAAKLDPGSALAAVNTAAALFSLKRFDEAAVAARHAVDLDPRMSKGRYILGVSLVAQKHYTDEALHSLTACAEEYPKARLLAAEILVQQGQTSEATQQLQSYLSAGNVQNRAQVESWLDKLQHEGGR